MSVHMPVVLARMDLGQLLLVLVIFGIPVVSTILKTLKTLGEKNKSQPTSRPPAGITQVEKLAARRRRELEEIARGRRTAQAGPPTNIRPANLTGEEARHRQEAKLAYERRAALLRQQQQAVRQPQRPMLTPPQARPTPIPQRPRPLGQMPQPVRQPGNVQHRPAPSSAPVISQRPTPPPPARTAPEQVKSGKAQQPAVILAAPGPAAPREADMPPGSVWEQPRLALSPHALRHAVILRELLDPPVALR